MASAAKPLVIDVAGGSGSGKTTEVRRIAESIGDGQVVVLEHDRYYRDRSRREDGRKAVSLQAAALTSGGRSLFQLLELLKYKI